MQKYLITGGAGFIGSHLVQLLTSLGKDVVVFDNLFSGKLENLNMFIKPTNFIKGDVNNYKILEKTIKGFLPDVVVHFAAIPFIPYCNTHPKETVNVNVDGTYALLDACNKYRPKKVLFASSASVYPPLNKPHRETHETRPFDIYGATKICGEALMQLYSSQTRVPTISCRIFCAYGPRSTYEYVITHIINQLKLGKKKIQIGNLYPKRDFIYVYDVANALYRLSLADIIGYEKYNIGTGIEYSIKELIEKIGQIASIKIDVQAVNKFKRTIDRSHLWADISKIEKEIGWIPEFDIDRGLSTLIRVELERTKMRSD